MNILTLSFVAQAMNAELLADNTELVCTGVNTDTRKISKGDLFVALPGAVVDGHDYINEAEARGAVGVVVSRKVKTKLPMLLVPDTLEALGRLAKIYRQQFQLPIVALTGSCGKTTVKEMLAGILTLHGPTLFTQGNLNTEVGVPLTLLGLSEKHGMAIVEMGARKENDIAYLMSLTSPMVSLITNAGVAHLEIFGSEKGIAKAKGEIFEYLPAGGTAIINQDDVHADYWHSLLNKGQKVITFGLHVSSQITAKNIVLEPTFSQFELVTDVGKVVVRLLAPGIHNVLNALSAAAAARALDVNLNTIQMGLERFVPVIGRLQFKTGLQGICIIDDTYNANPISVRAALSVLAKAKGEKIFVMGDMFELGPDALLLHRQIGVEAKELGIHRLYGVGSLTEAAVQGFGLNATHYPDKASLMNALTKVLNPNMTILIKGSRGMRMEEVVLALTVNCQEKASC